ncbi:MAG: hypothetical protein ACR2OV_12775 [Hyphomicrobiaceae bacterium]
MGQNAIPILCALPIAMTALLSAPSFAGDGTKIRTAQAAPAAPGGNAPQPAQPGNGPNSGQGDAQGQDHRGPGCPYRKDQDLKLLV